MNRDNKMTKNLIAISESPSADEVLESMISTHVRLFREVGQGISHFDLFAICFNQAMEQLDIPSDQRDECHAEVAPLRVAFDYGAKVARRQEKKMSAAALGRAHRASIKSMRSSSDPKLSQDPPPSWLVEVLGGQELVVAWTTSMTDRFVVQDDELSKTFCNVAYVDLEPYCHALLQLAFANQFGNNVRLPMSVLRIVRFPCGLTKADMQLSKGSLSRITNHIFEIGISLGKKDQCWLSPGELAQVTDGLRQKLAVSVGNDEATANWWPIERHYRLGEDLSQAPPEPEPEQPVVEETKFHQDLKSFKSLKKISKDRTSKRTTSRLVAKASRREHGERLHL